MFNIMYPDHWDTLHLQIANIACFFANIYTQKKGGGKWSIDDFMVKFESKKQQEKPKGNISEMALGMAVAFGDDKTRDWAEGKLKDKGIDVKSEDEDKKEYKYPLEKFVKNVKKLPARLRKLKNK